jgi:hypothetical protein
MEELVLLTVGLAHHAKLRFEINRLTRLLVAVTELC